MSAKIEAIAAANTELINVGLPRYDDLVVLLRAVENKFAAMRTYHSGNAAQSIDGIRSKISDTLAGVPFP